MSNTIQISYSTLVNGVPVSSSVQTASGSSLLQITETIANAGTNIAVACSIDEDALAGFFLSSNYDVTVKTNSSGSPQETIALKAGVPVVWTSGSVGSKPISDDVTALYITNASGSSATVTLIAITDATP
jgi:hypothetical protein